MGGPINPRCTGFAEANTDVVLKGLKFLPDSDYTGYLKRKLVEWYQAAPKSDRHALIRKNRGKEVDRVRAAVRAQGARCLIWTNEPLQSDFDAKEDRQTDVGDEHTEGLHLIQTG